MHCKHDGAQPNIWGECSKNSVIFSPGAERPEHPVVELPEDTRLAVEVELPTTITKKPQKQIEYNFLYRNNDLH